MAASALAPLLVVGGIALTGGLIYAAWRAEKRRVEALRVAAQMMGFTFEEQADITGVGDFPLFNHGRSSRLRNASRGELGGRAALIAEFSYVVSSGKSSHTVRQSVVVFMNQDTSLPDFELSPENVLHRLGQVFGYQDIDFESHETFSKKYLLRGADEEAIRRVFSSEALGFFESQPGWSAQSRGGRLMVFRAAKTADPAQLPVFAADTLRIAGALSIRA